MATKSLAKRQKERLQERFKIKDGSSERFLTITH